MHSGSRYRIDPDCRPAGRAQALARRWIADCALQGVHTLGMLFPIDVVVLDGQWNVLALRRRMKQFRMTRVFWRAAAVLELPPGTLDSTSTAVGDTLSFDHVAKLLER